MRFYEFTLLVAVVVAQKGHGGHYKMKLQQGALLSNSDGNSSQLPHVQRRADDDCGPVLEECNGYCKRIFDVCCEDGGVCGMGEKCMDGGTCCDFDIVIDFDKTCSSDISTASCRDDEENCGSKCMPIGEVCCPDKRTYCPSGYACADNKCKPVESPAGRAQPPCEAAIVGIVATFGAAFLL